MGDSLIRSHFIIPFLIDSHGHKEILKWKLINELGNGLNCCCEPLGYGDAAVLMDWPSATSYRRVHFYRWWGLSSLKHHSTFTVSCFMHLDKLKLWGHSSEASLARNIWKDRGHIQIKNRFYSHYFEMQLETLQNHLVEFFYWHPNPYHFFYLAFSGVTSHLLELSHVWAECLCLHWVTNEPDTPETVGLHLLSFFTRLSPTAPDWQSSGLGGLQTMPFCLSATPWGTRYLFGLWWHLSALGLVWPLGDDRLAYK